MYSLLLSCQLHDGSGFYLRGLASEQASANIVFIIELAERYTANLSCSEINSNMKFKYQSYATIMDVTCGGRWSGVGAKCWSKCGGCAGGCEVGHKALRRCLCGV